MKAEQESIEGAGKKRQCFRKNIETIYENNFKNKLPIEEYESIIFDICISKTLIAGDMNEAKIAKKIQDAVVFFLKVSHNGSIGSGVNVNP